MNFTDIMSLVESGTISFDDVKEYNENVHMISEAYTNGEITHDQKEELMLENRRVYFGDLFEEKASRVEYTMRQFKKKYHYDPQKKTIIVNGETYKCDLDIKNKVIDAYNIDGKSHFTIRSTSSNMADPDRTIFLDATFFNLKNNKRRDALLQHEVGHQKMHSITGDYDFFVNDLIESTMKKYGMGRFRARSIVVSLLNSKGLTKDKFTTPSSEELSKLRKEIRMDLDKNIVLEPILIMIICHLLKLRQTNIPLTKHLKNN